ncbi:hypothetical protein BDF20DRAFT_997747 [Mycotypha africana]|uniref:uncharacterized protein n=1 Tax=Mycotypha africana TaxID=64632 RepID=UPI002300ADF1|nr:uncharacterized protein BDF20DRAFT_997747 [Mycotypha africana]KAI8991991.1 hypothetical protein BDF20DRAFT_997747 [Mycotypha africana]
MSSLISTGVKKNKKTFTPNAGRRKDRSKAATNKSTQRNEPEPLPAVPSLTQSTDLSQSFETQTQLLTQDAPVISSSSSVTDHKNSTHVSITTALSPSSQLEASTSIAPSVKIIAATSSVADNMPDNTVNNVINSPRNPVEKAIHKSAIFVEDDDINLQDETADMVIPKVESPKPSIEEVERAVQSSSTSTNTSTTAATSVRIRELKIENGDDSDNEGASVIKVHELAGIKSELKPQAVITSSLDTITEESLTEEELAINGRNSSSMVSTHTTDNEKIRGKEQPSLPINRKAHKRKNIDESGEVDEDHERDIDIDGDEDHIDDDEQSGASTSASTKAPNRHRKKRKHIAKKLTTSIETPSRPRKPSIAETVDPPSRLRPRQAPAVAIGIPTVASVSDGRVVQEVRGQNDSDESHNGADNDSEDIDIDEIDELESMMNSDHIDTFLERRRRRAKSMRGKTKGKGRGRPKDHFRLVENMKTLEDLANDETPHKASHLEKPMSYFIKDIDGIVSKTYKEMEIARQAELKKQEALLKMSPEEAEELRKKEEEEKRAKEEMKAAEKLAADEERRRREAERPVLTESSNAVQVRIVNGEIVLDTDTLVVERHQGRHDEGFNGDAMEVVEENAMTRKVNSTTHGRREKSAKWDELETEGFYDLLSQFGTDFNTISKMMPGRTRNQIRSKFNKEERMNPWKVTEYLVRKKKPVNLDKFREIVGELDAVPEEFTNLELA